MTQPLIVKSQMVLASALQRCRYSAKQNNPGAVIELRSNIDDSRSVLADGKLVYTIHATGGRVLVYNNIGRQVVPGGVNLPLPAALRFIKLYWSQSETVH